MLTRARQQGRVLIVVLPVASSYTREFLTPEVIRDFESALSDAHQSAPEAVVVRLDRVPALSSSEYFSDFVHLNSAGRAIATEAFIPYVADRDPQTPTDK
jgi:hypothetical protein